MQSYHNTHDCFPYLKVSSADGKPLFGWRTAILPYLDEKPLYDTIHLDKPWNAPANATARNWSIMRYRSAHAQSDENSITNIFAVTGPGTCFEDGRACKLRDISDGARSTAMLFVLPELQRNWADPKDLTATELKAHLQSLPRNKFISVLFADGAARAFRVEQLTPIFDAMVMRRDGKPFELPN